MEKEQEIKELEERISKLQGIIDRLCTSADCAQKAGVKAMVEIVCTIKLVHSDETTQIDSLKEDDISIDAVISWVQTEKRLVEILLNQLKVEETE